MWNIAAHLLYKAAITVRAERSSGIAIVTQAFLILRLLITNYSREEEWYEKGNGWFSQRTLLLALKYTRWIPNHQVGSLSTPTESFTSCSMYGNCKVPSSRASWFIAWYRERCRGSIFWLFTCVQSFRIAEHTAIIYIFHFIKNSRMKRTGYTRRC